MSFGMGTITIRIPDSLRKQVVALCKQQGRPMSDLVRDSLRRYVAIQKFQALRAKAMPFAEAQGFLADEDIFNALLFSRPDRSTTDFPDLALGLAMASRMGLRCRPWRCSSACNNPSRRGCRCGRRRPWRGGFRLRPARRGAVFGLFGDVFLLVGDGHGAALFGFGLKRRLSDSARSAASLAPRFSPTSISAMSMERISKAVLASRPLVSTALEMRSGFSSTCL
jgi:predicted transcriptional regulator